MVLIYVKGWVDSSTEVQQEGLCLWKIKLKPSGIEPVTFRVVKQSPNQLGHLVPSSTYLVIIIFNVKSIRKHKWL